MPVEFDRENALALFVDFENLAGATPQRKDRFDIQRILKRMVEKGKIVAKKTYADWSKYSNYTESLHEAAFELVEIPKRTNINRSNTGIKLCVDAMDLAYSKPHISTFVIVSGDSDFSPLVSKLKEMGKHVIGLGMQGNSSELFRDNCDEFIYYEDLDVDKTQTQSIEQSLPENKRRAFGLLIEACTALRRENKGKLWGSALKETMKRKKPSFNESYHGYRSFSALLEDAQENNLVQLDVDPASGVYVVMRFGDEIKNLPAAAPAKPRERERDRPRFQEREHDNRRVRTPSPRRGSEDRKPRERIQETPPSNRAEVTSDLQEPAKVRRQDFADFKKEATSLRPRSNVKGGDDFVAFGKPKSREEGVPSSYISAINDNRDEPKREESEDSPRGRGPRRERPARGRYDTPADREPRHRDDDAPPPPRGKDFGFGLYE